MKNILLVVGGGGTEHEISLISSEYIASQVDSNKFALYQVEITKNHEWKYQGQSCSINFNRELEFGSNKVDLHAAIPCIHGYPGETGDIQSFFELIKLPYFGCNPQTSILCFNKLATKLLLESYGVQTTPFIQIINPDETDLASQFFNKHKSVYVKATNQGSSVGCYKVDKLEELTARIKEAFQFSPFVILEKNISGRELEVAAFEYNGEIHTTVPGEIICPNDFYTYEEKYATDSATTTETVAKNIPDTVLTEIAGQSQLAFKALKLRHLSRIDFFYTDEGEVLINEINTFPGHTKISMFPSMMENHGVKYSDFINQHLDSLVEN